MNQPHHPHPRQYQLRVAGSLSAQWSEWFEGLAITPAENGETLITGWVADQAALHGLLKKVRDVGLPLLSVNPLEPGAPGGADASGDSIQKE
ncbi:MAG: hypothetical protein IT318_08955 [Anaerolineales bacterium]|nr:hypothetical protein [Anaerolineales bacterium]